MLLALDLQTEACSPLSDFMGKAPQDVNHIIGRWEPPLLAGDYSAGRGVD
jgi:hypothetical protein